MCLVTSLLTSSKPLSDGLLLMPKLEKMESLEIAPVQRIEGTVKLPGSKSLSNRILLLAALAEGTTNVQNLLVST